MTGKKFQFSKVADIYDKKYLMPGFVYVCDSWSAAIFLCPCECGEQIILNLLDGTKPKWTISGNTITPSINRIVGCKSHFSIVNGEVQKN